MLYRAITLLVLVILQFSAAAGVSSFEGRNGNIPYYKYRIGSNYLLVEVLDNHLLHFEYRPIGTLPEGKFLDETRIFVTPMVARHDFPGPDKSKRISFRVDADLCLLFFDGGKYLTTVCPVDLEKGYGKGLNINPDATRNAYGLGQHFRNPGQADGDWVGSVFEPGEMGNQMRPFANGAPIVTQIPILYGLGEGKQTYGLFLDQAYKQKWDLSKYWWEYRTGGPEIRGFMIAGGDLPDVRRKFMDLVGRPPVPPKNILGYWVSEFGFESFNEIDAILKGGRLPWGAWRRKWLPNEGWVWREYQPEGSRGLFEDGFPVDGLACDLQWYGGEFEGNRDWGVMGKLEWDKDNFPNAPEKIRSLRENDGVDLMLIEQSYVGTGDAPGMRAQFDDLASRGYLAKDRKGGPMMLYPGGPWFWNGGMIDWTDDAAASYWHKKKRVSLIDMGIRKHWTDLAEPEIYSPEAIYHGIEPGRHDHWDIHNLYGLKWVEGISQGYAATHPNERFYSMARAGAAGIQRFGAGMWSGDIAANRASFTAHLNARMHMSLAGVDYYSSDIGGFHRRAETMDYEGALPELYTQWFAAGSFVDIPVRTHVWNLDNTKPSAANRVGDLRSNLENIRLRYELTPYYYSLAHLASRDGDPVLPPLVYYYQEDPNVRKIGNQILIGKDLMVGVTANYGETERNVYLPAGKWIDYRNNEWMESRGEYASQVPVYREGKLKIPFFARAGAIIPKMHVDEKTRNVMGKRTDGSRAEELVVRVFADSEESRFTLFEDDGVTKNQGVRSTELSQKQDGKSAIITIAASQGGYPGAPGEREVELELVVDGMRASGAKVFVEGKQVVSSLENAARNFIRVRSDKLPVDREKRIEVTLEKMSETSSAAFNCYNGKTALGESIYISGSLPELGEWDPKRAVRIDRVPFHWTWHGLIGGLPKDRNFKWKCVKLREWDMAELKWDEGPDHTARTGTRQRHGYDKLVGDLKL